MDVFKRGLFIFLLLGAGLVRGGEMNSSTQPDARGLFSCAEVAYELGSFHFNAQSPEEYDIKRAQFFFELTARIDPRYPYVHHQLARTAFLDGDFNTALEHINTEIGFYGAKHANSFYVRGLINGFMGRYGEAARDYETYLRSDPTNWAAINDYAWVLLKAHRAKEAAVTTASGLAYHPDNPWLLNTNAIALYEVGLVDAARKEAQKALLASRAISARDWLTAYPGNDPQVAREGIEALQSSIRKNIHTLLLAPQKTEVQ